MELVQKILEWPVIVQGALGSFLFWLLFVIGQKVISFSRNKVKKDSDLGSSFGRCARNDFYDGNYEFSNYNFFICIYGALHYFLKFVIITFASFLIVDIIPVFGYVGYISAFYFIFRSISYVTHFRVFEKEDDQAKKETEKMNETGKLD